MVVKLDDLVAEHLDHLHYLNDILLLKIDDLNIILTDHLLNRLLIPLYIYSLVTENQVEPLRTSEETNPRPRISSIISLFLLSQVFLILSYEALVQKLVHIILYGDMSIFEKPEFAAPPETLEESLIQVALASNNNSSASDDDGCSEDVKVKESVETEIDQIEVDQETVETDACIATASVSNEMPMEDDKETIEQINASCITDEEKAAAASGVSTKPRPGTGSNTPSDDERPFLDALFNSLDCTHKLDDHSFIFSLCLIYAVVHNKGRRL